MSDFVLFPLNAVISDDYDDIHATFLLPPPHRPDDMKTAAIAH